MGLVIKGAFSTGDYTDDTERRSTRLWKQLLENDMKLQPYRKDNLPGRNKPCPCGSGKKAKKCCLNGIKAFAALPAAVRQQIAVNRILQQHLMAAAGPTAVQIVDGVITTADGIAVPVESREIIAIADPIQPAAESTLTQRSHSSLCSSVACMEPSTTFPRPFCTG